MSAAAPARRKRGPVTYDVFESQPTARVGSGEDMVDAWVHIGTVEANSRKEAIVQATADRDEKHRFGLFATVRADEFKQQRRAKRVIEEDDWSGAAEGSA